MTELDKIVADISAKLGVRLFFREESRAEKEDVCAAGGRSDGKHTYFRFSFHGKDYTGVLDGATKTEKNYAALLPAYIAAFEEKNGELTKEEYLKKLLLGDCSAADAYKYSIRFSVKETPCFVLAVRFIKAYPEAYALLLQYGDDKTDAVVKFD